MDRVKHLRLASKWSKTLAFPINHYKKISGWMESTPKLGAYVRYSEGAEMYHMSVSKFMQMAKDAKAVYKLGQLVLVNLTIFDEYIETFHIVDDEFYK